MLQLLDILSFLLKWAYVFILFYMLLAFLPLRSRHMIFRVVAIFASSFFSLVVVYANDLANLLGSLAGFILYITIFHKGRWTDKAIIVLVFYPAVIAVNYLLLDMGSRLFFESSGADSDLYLQWTQEQKLLSTGIHTFSLLLRLLFWLGAWLFFRKYMKQMPSNLTKRLQFIIMALMSAPLIAVFTIIYFLPAGSGVAYPICAAAIFSSFGCIYLVAFICDAVQTAYYVRELEMKQSYFKDRMIEEERVRSIYHDMKNHLLILQAKAGAGPEVEASVLALQNQILEYENYYHTGNDFLDIIIRDKAQRAREMQIDFSPQIYFEDGSFIDPLDISTIFGNALDNAIEACEKLPAEQRLITIRAELVREMLVILVENNALSGKMSSGVTTKKDAFLHGFGVANIRKAVEKYGGECVITCKPGGQKHIASTVHQDNGGDLMAVGRFCLKIILPLPGYT